MRHPNILSMKNADIINGYTVLATELSAGTLSDCPKPMSVRRITSIIIQVLEGLAYAHRHRLVHCDVTPSNIFIFPDKTVALGDFGICIRIKGRPSTIEDYGTPGYVAPEQAFGRPTYRSDCFAVALVLYEYITGVLPKWPFRWPMKGYKRLKEKTNTAMVRFMRKALAVEPEKRFPNAGKMLEALLEALPKNMKNQISQKVEQNQNLNWRRLRSETFLKRYSKIFPVTVKCSQCSEPISESMLICPWCGSDRNRFDKTTAFSHVCPYCHRGVLPEWRFCPWCYSPGFKSPLTTHTKGIKYHSRCKYCRGRIMRFMRYCPWCHRKIRRPWQEKPFPEICTKCGWSVDSTFWNYCPWCRQRLIR